MTSITDIREMKARIIVFGVGGAGGNAVNNMIAARAPLEPEQPPPPEIERDIKGRQAGRFADRTAN
jgi:hypothetical protein